MDMSITGLPEPAERARRRQRLCGPPLRDISIDEAGEWARQDGHVVWIGLHEPAGTAATRAGAARPASAGDRGCRQGASTSQARALRRRAVHRGAHRAADRGGEITFGETHIFVGKGYVVSVRHGASTSYAAVRERCGGVPDACSRAARTTSSIRSSTSSSTTTCRSSRRSRPRSTRSRTACCSKTLTRAEVERLYKLRRELLRLRKAVGAAGRGLPAPEHADACRIDPQMQRSSATSPTMSARAGGDRSLREVLAFAFEASLMAGQAQQNAITRKLAAWAAILAVPTAVAGIYGMNFEHMPELQMDLRLLCRRRRDPVGLHHALRAVSPLRLALIAGRSSTPFLWKTRCKHMEFLCGSRRKANVPAARLSGRDDR